MAKLSPTDDPRGRGFYRGFDKKDLVDEIIRLDRLWRDERRSADRQAAINREQGARIVKLLLALSKKDEAISGLHDILRGTVPQWNATIHA